MIITYEQRRIRTLRSTWIILIITVVLAALFAAGFSALANLDPVTGNRVGVGPLKTVLPAIVNPVLLVALSVMAAMSFGGEFRFGLSRLTFTAFPRRTSVMFAKLWIVVLWTLAFLILATLTVLGVAWAFSSSVNFNPQTVANLSFMGRALLYGLGYCLFVFALVLITRSQAISVVLVVLWSLIVEQALVALLSSHAEWLPKVLPMTSGAAFVDGTDMVRNGLVFLVYLVVFMVAGWLLLVRRDA